MTTTHSSPPSTHHLRIRYIASLCALAVLATLGHAVIQTVLVRWLPDSQVINIAGRQRMFSQQLSKGALFIQVDVNPSARQQRVEELRGVLALWERSHLGLQRGNAELAPPGRNSSELIRRLAGIEPEYQAICGAGKSLVALYNRQGPKVVNASDVSFFVATILAHEQDFLDGMDSIVSQYKEGAIERGIKLTKPLDIQRLLQSVDEIIRNETPSHAT